MEWEARQSGTTIDGKVKDLIEKKRGFTMLIAGSNSDENQIAALHAELDRFLLPHDVAVSSAHKMPARTEALVQAYNMLGGSMAFVTIAGGLDALSGTVSYSALNLTISSPPESFNATCLQNPPGSSNLYIKSP